MSLILVTACFELHGGAWLLGSLWATAAPFFWNCRFRAALWIPTGGSPPVPTPPETAGHGMGRRNRPPDCGGHVLTVCIMPKTELDGLPVIETDESEEITVAIKADGLRKADIQDAIATALRQQGGVDDARVSKREVLIRRGDQWFRYGAPKRVS